MLRARIIELSELYDRIEDFPDKLYFRLNAVKAGWQVPNFYVIEIIDSDRDISDTIDLSTYPFHKTLFTITVHIMILRNRNSTEETRRWFKPTSELNAFLPDLMMQGFDRIMITEVKDSDLSGIACARQNVVELEVAYGKMIAKGNVETSRYRLENGILVHRQEILQKHVNRIQDDGTLATEEMSDYPRLNETQIAEVQAKCQQFNRVVGRTFSIEWFTDPTKIVYYLDVMEEITSQAPEENINSNNGDVFLKNFDLVDSDENPIIFARAPRIIAAGKCEGVPSKISSNIQDVLDLHYEDSRRSEICDENATGDYVYFCDAPVLSYLPLLNSARGFIFEFGSSLSHLGNLIRSRNIPACIDAFLFNNYEKLNEHIEFQCCVRNGNIPYLTLSRSDISHYCDALLNSPLVLPIVNCAPEYDPKEFGWKALNLNYLASYGFQIPRTLFLTVDFVKQIIVSPTSTPIEPYIISGEKFEQKPFEVIIHETFPDVSLESGRSLICRSSSTVEDGFEHSAAGIFDSIPNISRYDELFAAISQIADINYSPRVNHYCVQEEIDSSSIQMGVIIQEYIQPFLSGVLFTRIPPNQSGGREVMRLELALNNSDGVTSGRDTPFTVDIPIDYIADDQTMTRIITDQVSLWPEFFNISDLCVLLKDLISKCEKLGTQIHVPLDFEFIIDENLKLWFVQCRPVLCFGKIMEAD